MFKLAKFSSPALRRGFRKGFAAPYQFLIHSKSTRYDLVNVSLAGAWVRVGKALDRANVTEGQRVGEAAGKSSKKDRVAV